MTPTTAEFRAGIYEMLQQPGFDWLRERSIAATLTFRPRIDNEFLTERIAQCAVRHLLRRLDLSAYGKQAARWGRKIGSLAIREGADGPYEAQVHYHLELEVPRHRHSADWIYTSDELWEKLEWASPRQNRFKIVRSPGWQGYILKGKGKPSFIDAIDFENTRMAN